ncbi:MAG: alkaline phosphatase family protein [Chloroflexi bacterium]|nr:alkaline phosphatase family protein [Chloroflexota bacterium]
MSDIEKLLAAFLSGRLLRPSSGVPSLVDLSRALASLAGAEGVQPTQSSTALASLIGPADHLVFVLADGLGMNLIEELPPDNFLRTHLAAEIRTVFPSATATALTSLATGEWPGRHGVTGWWTHLPAIESAAAMLPFVTRAEGRSLAGLGVTAEEAFPLPSLMGKIPRDTLALFPGRIAQSVFSAYYSGGRPRHGYKTLQEAADVTVARVTHASAPTYTYLYTPIVDNQGHRYGVGRPQVHAALQEMGLQIERLATGLNGHGRIVLSADHGLLDAPASVRHRLTPSYDLMAALRFPPSGDARVLYFHLRNGADSGSTQALKRHLGDHFLLISVDEAEGLALFGPDPISPLTRSRLGDMIAISQGPDVIEYQPAGVAGRVMREASHHSGLTPSEMRVPLVLA